MHIFSKRLNLIVASGLLFIGSYATVNHAELISTAIQVSQPKPASPVKNNSGPAKTGVAQNPKSATTTKQNFGISVDRKSTLNKEFSLRAKDNELPLVVCKYKIVQDNINGYLYESLVAEEFDEVNGDEELPGNGQAAENKEEEKSEIDMDMDSLIENAADMNIYGEIDYYDGQVIGVSIMMESISHKSIDRNHYLFNALTGEVVDVWAIKSLAGKKLEWMQRVKNAYAEAVDIALNTPCLLADQNAADLLLTRKILKDSDFQMDEFTRSQALYVRDGKLIFDYTVLKRCDPGGVQLTIQ